MGDGSRSGVDDLEGVDNRIDGGEGGGLNDGRSPPTVGLAIRVILDPVGLQTAADEGAA